MHGECTRQTFKDHWQRQERKERAKKPVEGLFFFCMYVCMCVRVFDFGFESPRLRRHN